MEEITHFESKPTVAGTLALMLACLGAFLANSETALVPSQTAHSVSLILGGGIILNVLLDWRKGLRNLIRADLFALSALFFLLYFEFLFPQPRFDDWAIPADVQVSINLTLVGFAALGIGRHIPSPSGMSLSFIGEVELKHRHYVIILLGCFLLANLYKLMMVGFNPVEWLVQTMGPRFSQPWSRGRIGGVTTLLSEMALLEFVVPPLCGVIFARWKEYSKGALVLTTFCLLVVLFSSFAGGTRNVLGVNLVSLIGGYLIIQRHLKLWRVVVAAALIGVVFTIAADHMLSFRQIGLKRYIDEGLYTSSYREFSNEYMGESAGDEETYFVDYNLYNMSMLVAAFPGVYDYLGWNVPFVALTKPIPRILWPSKPTDLKVGLEEAVGAKGFTISCTFIGEGYISAGMLGVILMGLAFGYFSSWWNHLSVVLHSPYTMVVYASGFYALLIGMRSIMFVSTAFLPTLALIVLGKLIHLQQKKRF